MSELRPQSRALLAAARLERTPSKDDRERVFRAMLVGAALTASPSAAAAPSLLAKLTSAATKWWLLGGVCLAVAGGAQLARPSEAERSVASNSAGLQGGAVPARAPATAPSATIAVAPSAAVAEPNRVLPAASSPRVGAAKIQSLQPNLEEELRLLHAAHDAYGAGQPKQALSLLATHRARFPKSQFTSERATLEVLSLCRAGRQADARRLADGLRRSSPTGTTLAGLEGSCAAPAAK